MGAVLTAFYMFRMWFLTFAGEPRGFPSTAEAVHSHVHDEEHALDHGTRPRHDRNPAAHAHESEPIMTWPLFILAFCSIFSGWTLCVWRLPFGTPIAGTYARIRRAVPGDRSSHRACTTYALAASLLIMLDGRRPGLALLCSARASLTSCRPA